MGCFKFTRLSLVIHQKKTSPRFTHLVDVDWGMSPLTRDPDRDHFWVNIVLILPFG